MIRILVAAGSISLLSAMPTAAQNTPFSDLDVFQVEYASDVQISPDGGWVVYVRTAMSIMRDRREGRLWMVRTDGTRHRQLTSSDQSQSSPAGPLTDPASRSFPGAGAGAGATTGRRSTSTGRRPENPHG